MKLEKMFLNAEDFWKEYSKRYLKIRAQEKVPKSTCAEFALNHFFGDLTEHKVSECNGSKIEITCQKCKNCEKEKNVCDTHVGCILGLFESMNIQKYNAKINSKKDCKITLIRKGESYEKS